MYMDYIDIFTSPIGWDMDSHLIIRRYYASEVISSLLGIKTNVPKIDQ